MIRVRAMTAADVPLGMRLKQQAGWNQLEADWQRFLDLEPDGCFVAERDGTPVGTTTTCIFGPVAWVAMVLVDAALRGQGIGKALMQHALAFLDESGVRSVRLDATPLGQPLYEKLGFVVQYQLARYEGVLPPVGAAPGIPVITPEHLDEWLQRDQEVTATDRSKLLRRLFAEQPDALRGVDLGARGKGFLTVRPGMRALQIGPCIASGGAGLLLFADAWQRYAGQSAFIDIPMQNMEAGLLAQGQGLTVQRHLTRMCRGEEVCERIGELWASSGPEMG